MSAWWVCAALLGTAQIVFVVCCLVGWRRTCRELRRRATRRRRGPIRAPQPDYARIAVLEYELFGIEPKPGTLAAFAVGLQQIQRQVGGRSL